MIQRVDDTDKTRAYCAKIAGFDGERFEEVLDLLDLFDGRVVLDGFTGEPAADRVDCATSNLQARPPASLKRDGRSRFGKSGIETTDGRLAAFARDPNDEPREAI